MRINMKTMGVASALVVATATTAVWADDAVCPPGAFCEDVAYEVEPEEEPAETPTKEKPVQKKAPAKTTKTSADKDSVTVVLPQGADTPRVFVVKPGTKGDAPQIVEYRPADSVKKIITERRRRHRRWGLNMRFDGVMMPNGDDDGPNMGGLGMSLRYRPVPAFALSLSVDLLNGQDLNGYERTEIPVGVSGILYAFPRSFLQPYLMFGLNGSLARVQSTEPTPMLKQGTHGNYSYFGAHAGLGLEFRMSRLIGLSIDGLGFVRKRVDKDAHDFPEFVDADTGQTSNASAGGMIRVGLTFWW